jgi:hypothetical protein
MWVEHIEDGTFAGGSEDAYHFDAREKGAEFLVIRKADYDRLLSQLAASRPTAEMVEACAREIAEDVHPFRSLDPRNCLDREGASEANEEIAEARVETASNVAAIIAEHFNPEKKP